MKHVHWRVECWPRAWNWWWGLDWSRLSRFVNRIYFANSVQKNDMFFSFFFHLTAHIFHTQQALIIVELLGIQKISCIWITICSNYWFKFYFEKQWTFFFIYIFYIVCWAERTASIYSKMRFSRTFFST